MPPRHQIDHQREGIGQAAFAGHQRDLPLPQIQELARQLLRIVAVGRGLGRHGLR
jgi:hypothetical protein